METFIVTYNANAAKNEDRPGAIIAFPPAKSFLDTLEVFSTFLPQDAKLYAHLAEGDGTYDDGKDLGNVICEVPLKEISRARMEEVNATPQLFSNVGYDMSARLPIWWYVRVDTEPYFNGHYSGIWLPKYDEEIIKIASDVAKAPFSENELRDLENILKR